MTTSTATPNAPDRGKAPVRPILRPVVLPPVDAPALTPPPVPAPRVGVVVPVHDEERLLPAALASLDRSVAHAATSVAGPMHVVIVLDSCTDGSRHIAEQWRDTVTTGAPARTVELLTVAFSNVGRARSAGCQVVLRRWPDARPSHLWLATTDADSEVPLNWIDAQVRARADGAHVWLGGVRVEDWDGRAPGTAEAWRHHDDQERLPVHGANFGIDAATYLEAGGFPGLPTSEDRALADRAIAMGAVVHGDADVRVTTSGRRAARAPHGFAHALATIEAAVTTRTRATRPCPSY